MIKKSDDGKSRWFQSVSGPDLLQGDIIFNANVPIPVEMDQLTDYDASKTEKIKPPFDIMQANLIVLTQSCDIQKKKVDTIVLCPIWTFEEIEKIDSQYKDPAWKESLRQGLQPSYHLLSADKELGFDFLVVDFHRLYTLPKAFVMSLANKRNPRPRLISPYREHLSQAFARYFMRVGLPSDIPKFKKA